MRARAALAAMAAGLLLLAGCTPAPPSPTGSPSPTSAVESGPLVHTDWSQLTPYQPFEAVEERWYEEYTDRLIPREDYGTLVPYAVPRSTYQLSWDDDGTLYTHQSYGFADRTGRVVTDPVFSSIYQFTAYLPSTGQVEYLPCWVISSGEILPGEENARCAVAALDGSWCTGFDYLGPSEGMGLAGGEDGLLLFDLEDRCAVLLSPEGKELLSIPAEREEFSDYWDLAGCGYDLMMGLSVSDGIVVRQRYDENYSFVGAELYDLSAGTWTELPDVTQVSPFSEGLAAARDGESGLWGYLDPRGEWAIAPAYTAADSFTGGQAIVWDGDRCLLLDTAGRTVRDLGLCEGAYRTGGYLSVTPLEGAAYWLDENGRQTPQELDGAQVTCSIDGCLCYSTGGELVRLFPDREVRLSTDYEPLGLNGDLLTLYRYDEAGQSWSYAMMDLSGQLLYCSDRCSSLYLLKDPLEPDAPALAVAMEGERYIVLSREGEPLFTSTAIPERYGDLLQASDSFSAGLRDLEGNWVLRLSSFGESLD